MSQAILERLLAMDSLDESVEANSSAYIQAGRTRIASLVLASLDEIDIHQDRVAGLEHSPDGAASTAVHLKSPLSVVYDFLTVPEMPGTRAYALLACRNFLFMTLKLAPSLDGKSSPTAFGVQDIQTSLSYVWTSFRERHNSKGQDKLPPGYKGSVEGLLRQFLAMKGMLHLRFRNLAQCLTYLESTSVVPAGRVGLDTERSFHSFEFAKAPMLEKLPEVGEIINELWGLPIPIRGADTIFRGGLKFSSHKGLVMAVHGGPGTGKTSLALAIAAYAAPLGINTLFLTEEYSADLQDRLVGIVPDSVRRLSFFPTKLDEHISFTRYQLPGGNSEAALSALEDAFKELSAQLAGHANPEESGEQFNIPKPCKAIVVLDGLHDLFATGFGTGADENQNTERKSRLYSLIDTLRDLKAFVILTTGVSWAEHSALDYLVDTAIELTFVSTAEYGSKPDRRILLSKARHQLCAAGTHGLQIAGLKGIRFSPQINYQLERRSLWKSRLPSDQLIKPTLRRVVGFDTLLKEGDTNLLSISDKSGTVTDDDLSLYSMQQNIPDSSSWIDCPSSVDIFTGSHIFINGKGSGGKAALALKIGLTPVFARGPKNSLVFRSNDEKILIVSFLYPREYYDRLHETLLDLNKTEYGSFPGYERSKSRIAVIHLYPGYLKPNDLYNRIEWDLEAAELNGDPFTCVIVEGIHNVFLQFPEIQKYGLFWPQIYSLLRSRNVTTITTHATLSLPWEGDWGGQRNVDDARSEPLRHALVQKTDFQIEVNPVEVDQEMSSVDLAPRVESRMEHLFMVRTMSAIRQRIPRNPLFWSREKLILYSCPLDELVKKSEVDEATG